MPQDLEAPGVPPPTESFAAASSEQAIAGESSGLVAGWPAQIGSCRIQGEIGSGGMGVVLRGHDIDFGRTLAVKILRHTHAPNSPLAQRFLLEAQITITKRFRTRSVPLPTPS